MSFINAIYKIIPTLGKKQPWIDIMKASSLLYCSPLRMDYPYYKRKEDLYALAELSRLF